MTVEPTQRSLSIIVPAFNEGSRLPALMEEVCAYLRARGSTWELLIVDDGSTDHTAAVVELCAEREPRVRLLQHADGANHGKGAAVRLGMLSAVGEVRLFMDADNSTRIDQLEGVLAAFEDGCEFAVGSRRASGARIEVAQGPHRVAAGIIGNRLIRRLAFEGIEDTQAGFKALTADCAEAVFSRLTIERWAFDVEALVIARDLGFRICEVPIRWVNSDESKLRGIDYVRFLRDVLRIRANRRRGVYV